MANDNVVVDEEIRVVRILVLPGDIECSAVRQLRATASKPRETPSGSGGKRIGTGKVMIGGIGRDLGSNQPLPNWIGHLLGVTGASPGVAPIGVQRLRNSQSREPVFD